MRPVITSVCSVLWGVALSTFSGHASADGFTAAQLQTILSTGSTNNDITTFGQATQALALTAVQANGGDGSNVVVSASGSSRPRPLAARYAETINVADYGALADGVEGTVRAHAASGATTVLIANQNPPVPGSSVGVPQGREKDPFAPQTKVVRAECVPGGYVITLSKPLSADLSENTPVDFGSDNLAAFRQAQWAAQTRGGMRIVIPGPGSYFLSDVVYSVSNDTWEAGGGVNFIGGGTVIGFSQPVVWNAHTLAKTSFNPGNEVMQAAFLDTGDNGIHTSFEKIAYLANINTHDISGYQACNNSTASGGCILQDIMWAKDAVGFESLIHVNGGNALARPYAYHGAVNIDPGNDAYVSVMELELQNRAGPTGYTPQPGANNAKRALHIDTGGNPSRDGGDITEGIEVDGDQSSGRFHVAYDAFQRAIRPDGWFIGLWPTPLVDMATDPVAGIAQDGHLVASGVVSTAGMTAAGSLVVNGAATLSGPTTIRQEVVRELSTGYSPLPTDCGTTLRMTNDAPVTLKVGPVLPIGCSLSVISAGDGQVEFSASDALVIESHANAKSMNGKFAIAHLFVDSPTTVLITGELQ